MKTKKARVRFAPSPTGFLHIGSLRTALYNYLFAQKNGGDFLLRIEDTDRTRTVENGVKNIIQTLKWCGLDYDEGTKIKTHNTEYAIYDVGEYKPYIQSKRLEIYQKYARELVKKDRAYYCFCSPERLEALRQEQMARKEPTMYDGYCKTQNILKQSGPRVIRLKVPGRGVTKFKDIIRGEIAFENKLIDDQVLLKSDGYPTYHLANVVDDHLMQITHVIRGEEWLSSTPKHILLYKAFGWRPPQFAHLPLLLNPDRSKLSKRQGDVAVEDYIKKGYLREALINFIALLGWNPKSDKEFYDLDELIKNFELKNINKSGAVVNFEKLDWMNGYYLRQKSIKNLTQACIPFLIEASLIKIQNNNLPAYPSADETSGQDVKFKIIKTGEEVSFEWLTRIIALERERLKKLSEIVYATEFFFVDMPHYEPQILLWKKMTPDDILRHLKILIQFLDELPKNDWSNPRILETKIKNFIQEQKLGTGETLWPMRAALSGRINSPPPFDIAAILGKNRALARLEHGIKQVNRL